MTDPAVNMPKPTRAEQTRRERRMTPGATVQPGIRLAVDEKKLDRGKFEYRWVNDKEGRVQQLAAQDWDPVAENVKDDSNGLGTVPSAHAGVAEGKPYNATLMKKYRDWYEDDQKRKQRPLDEMENAIRRGNVQGQNTELAGAGVYTPGGMNTIERAS